MTTLTIPYIGYFLIGIIYYLFMFDGFYKKLNKMKDKQKLILATISLILLPTALIAILMNQIKRGH